MPKVHLALWSHSILCFMYTVSPFIEKEFICAAIILDTIYKFLLYNRWLSIYIHVRVDNTLLHVNK